MAVKRGKDGRWRFRVVVRDITLDDGSHPRISGTPTENTKEAARAMEREEVRLAVEAHRNPKAVRKEIPTFNEWFNGRFWREWVVARDQKPSERTSKTSIFKNHLDTRFGKMRLDEIDEAVINGFKADLLDEELAKKTINNVLAVLSKPLRYAEEVRVIERAPRVGIFRLERPEIDSFAFDTYGRVLEAAQREGANWYVAVLLAGDAGLRKGEIMALRFREDVDLVARTITVHRQRRYGHVGTPKGGMRRKVPMTERLFFAIKALSQVPEGNIVRDIQGAEVTDRQMSSALYRVCRLAGLPEGGWHKLRHTFGTHAALFGVNPWKLQSWMGHKEITETMRYVHVADHHGREIPPAVLEAARAELDPDRRIIAMLSARGAPECRGKPVANAEPALRLV